MRHAAISMLACALATCLAQQAAAQATMISLDGSLPHGRSDDLVATQPGPGYLISEDMGWRLGTNLFHSFYDFSIGFGDSATFTSNPVGPGSPALQHVVARVTGGNASQIDGALRSEISTADLYLLNPSGILFGVNSSIDVPRSLHLSTAHELYFEGDPLPLSLVQRAAPHLSAARPEAFGFLGGAPAGDIEFGYPVTTPKTLAMTPDSDLKVSAGNVAVRGRMQLNAPDGSIQLAAVGSETTRLPLDFASFDARDGDASRLGEVRLEDGAGLRTLSVAGDQGDIVIRGGRLVVAGGTIRAGGAHPTTGHAIDIEVAGDVVLQRSISSATGQVFSTLVGSETQSAADAGDLRIAATSVEIAGPPDGRGLVQVLSRTSGEGAGGDLLIEATTIAIRSGAQVAATTSSFSVPAPGAAGGRVVLRGDSVSLETGAQVFTRTATRGVGGDIVVDAQDLVVDRASLTAESSSEARGGAIQIDAASVTIRGDGAQVATFNTVSSAPDPQDLGSLLPGGDIVLDVSGDTLVSDGAVLSSETSGPQTGGDISITSGSLQIRDGGVVQTSVTGAASRGTGGAIAVQADRVEITRSAGASAAGLLTTVIEKGSLGIGGVIDLVVGALTLDRGGQISTTSPGDGPSGAISIVASGDVLARGEQVGSGGLEASGIFSRVERLGPGNAGSSNAGNVSISAENVQILEGAEISTRALGAGRSGDVSITAQGSIEISGVSALGNAPLVTARAVDGRAGNVDLTAASVAILDGAQVDVSAGGQAGGLLTVSATDLIVSGSSPSGVRSTLGAEAAGLGDAGGILLDVSGSLAVDQGGVVSAISRGGNGAAGNVTIKGTRELQIASGGSITAQSDDLQIANGELPGSIRVVDAGRVVVGPGGEISARGRGIGDGGSIEIAAVDIGVSGGTITADAQRGRGGDVTLTAASSVSLVNGASVAVRATGDRDAGSISIAAPRVELIGSTLLADANAYGGSIEINASNLVHILWSEIRAESRGGPNTQGLAGGNIVIDPPSVVINSSRLIAQGFQNADGGNILIHADAFVASADSVLSASSELGVEGVVAIDAPQSELASELATLPETFMDATRLLREACAVRDDALASLMVGTAARQLAAPDGPLAADVVRPAAGAEDVECREP